MAEARGSVSESYADRFQNLTDYMYFDLTLNLVSHPSIEVIGFLAYTWNIIHLQPISQRHLLAMICLAEDTSNLPLACGLFFRCLTPYTFVEAP